MNIKPRLVDPAWFAKPIPIPKPIVKIIKKTIIDPKANNSLIINLIGLLLLMIGGLCIYQRYMERENERTRNNNLIIGFNEYVKNNIKSK